MKLLSWLVHLQAAEQALQQLQQQADAEDET
jgi:hypothetical protein